MGSAFSALHLPAALAISSRDGSKCGHANFEALVAQCNNFRDNCPEGTPNVVIYDSEGDMVSQVFVDLNFESAACLRATDCEVICGNYCFDHYFWHQQEICRLRNILKRTLQEGRYSEHLLEKYKCSRCLVANKIPTEACFEKRIWVDALQHPKGDADVNCTCDLIIGQSMDAILDSNLCELHCLYVNCVNYTKNSLGWEIYFLENAEFSGFNNPGFVVQSQQPSPIVDDSSSFEIAFEHTSDPEFQLSVDIELGIDLQNLHHSPASQVSENSWLLLVDEEGSDEYETSSGSSDLHSNYNDKSQSKNGTFYDAGCECFGGSFCLDHMCVNYTGKHMKTSLSHENQANGLVLCSNVVSKGYSKYHECCSPQVLAVEGTDCNSRLSKKKVEFAADERLTTVHYMVAWNHAYRESRKTYWETFVSDRAHFQRRLHNLSEILEPVLQKKLHQILRHSEIHG